jgi:hypothetical protein
VPAFGVNDYWYAFGSVYSTVPNLNTFYKQLSCMRSFGSSTSAGRKCLDFSMEGWLEEMCFVQKEFLCGPPPCSRQRVIRNRRCGHPRTPPLRPWCPGLTSAFALSDRLLPGVVVQDELLHGLGSCPYDRGSKVPQDWGSSVPQDSRGRVSHRVFISVGILAPDAVS